MAQVQHYFISMTVMEPFGVYAYVMADCRESVERVAEVMCQAAEERSWNFVPLFSVVVLEPDGVAIVREVVRRHCPEAVPLLEAATDFHFTGFSLEHSDEDRALLDWVQGDDGPSAEVH